MSPTIFRERGFRFFFFSREEPRMHVHSGRGEAKFWLEPGIELARNYGLSDKDLDIVKSLIERHQHDIRSAWEKHFSG